MLEAGRNSQFRTNLSKPAIKPKSIILQIRGSVNHLSKPVPWFLNTCGSFKCLLKYSQHLQGILINPGNSGVYNKLKSWTERWVSPQAPNMDRQAQGWRCFHQKKVTKVTGSPLAVLSLALQLQPLVMVLFWGWVCLWWFCSFPGGDEVSDHEFCI